MAASNYFENKVLDQYFGGPDYARLGTVYLALYNANPGDAGTATTSEVTGTSYARAAITNDATRFPAAVNGAKSNGEAIDFPTPGAGGWGLVTYAALVDSASGAGNILLYGPLNVSKTINENDTVSFGIGDLTLVLD